MKVMRVTKAILLDENIKLRRELADSRDGYIRMIEKLQGLCEEFGCPPGLNRFDFLRRKLREAQTSAERD